MKRSQDWDPGELCGWSAASGARPPGTESRLYLLGRRNSFLIWKMGSEPYHSMYLIGLL